MRREAAVAKFGKAVIEELEAEVADAQEKMGEAQDSFKFHRGRMEQATKDIHIIEGAMAKSAKPDAPTGEMPEEGEKGASDGN